MRRRTLRRGFTLVELLVAMGLMSLLLTALYFISVSTVRDFIIESGSIDLEQNALVVLGRLSGELTESDASGYAVSSSPQGVTLVSPRTSTGAVNYDSSGNVYWQKYVCYYIRQVSGTSCLVRAEETLTTPSTTVPSLTGKDTTYFSNKQYNIIGREVTALTVGTAKPASISLTCRNSTLGNSNQLVVTTSVWIRN